MSADTFIDIVLLFAIVCLLLRVMVLETRRLEDEGRSRTPGRRR